MCVCVCIQYKHLYGCVYGCVLNFMERAACHRKI